MDLNPCLDNGKRGHHIPEILFQSEGWVTIGKDTVRTSFARSSTTSDRRRCNRRQACLHEGCRGRCSLGCAGHRRSSSSHRVPGPHLDPPRGPPETLLLAGSRFCPLGRWSGLKMPTEPRYSIPDGSLIHQRMEMGSYLYPWTSKWARIHPDGYNGYGNVPCLPVPVTHWGTRLFKLSCEY